MHGGYGPSRLADKETRLRDCQPLYCGVVVSMSVEPRLWGWHVSSLVSYIDPCYWYINRPVYHMASLLLERFLSPTVTIARFPCIRQKLSLPEVCVYVCCKANKLARL